MIPNDSLWKINTEKLQQEEKLDSFTQLIIFIFVSINFSIQFCNYLKNINGETFIKNIRQQMFQIIFIQIF